jgi:hypothetical protein
MKTCSMNRAERLHAGTVAAALRRTLAARHGVGLGASPTWGEIRRAVAVLGVDDDTPVALIEFGCARDGSGILRRDEDEHGHAELREVV